MTLLETNSSIPLTTGGDYSVNATSNITEHLLNNTLRPWNILEKAIFGTWLSISMVSAICGNLMVIVVVFRHKGMQTRTNMFLVNLAIADFLVGILLAPFSLTTLLCDRWIFGDFMCKMNGFLNTVLFVTSIHTLMYISLHKYVSITRPFSRILNRWKILVMSAAAWIWAIICAILTMFVLSKVVDKPGAMQCGAEYPRNKLEYLHHVIISSTNILIPLAIMTFAYARMYCEFRSHAARLRKNTTLQSDQILAQQIQVTKTLFIVLACFMLCWLPYGFYSSYVSSIKDKSKILPWANPAAYCFMYMNSGCNPIIYAWRSPSFREGYKEILCQESGFIVSDETVRESDSPSIIRRLSTMLHSSFRSSRWSNRQSFDGSSLNSLHISRTAISTSPSHTLLRRATSKTATGSSIIRKDGSVIITKNGKIISVRRDIDSIKRDRSFSGFEDLKVSKSKNVCKSLSDVNTIERDKLQLSPLLRPHHRSRASSGCSSVGRSPGSSNENISTKFGHTSLTKIDSVDEAEIDGSHGNTLCLPNKQAIFQRQNSQSNSNKNPEPRETIPSLTVSQENMSCSPSIKSDSDEVFMQTPITSEFTSQEHILNIMPLQPKLKINDKIAKSDNQLDKRNSTENISKKKNKKLSKSSNNVLDNSITRFPSIEKLDVPIVKASSSNCVIKKLVPKSPLFVRRWINNRSCDSLPNEQF